MKKEDYDALAAKVQTLQAAADQAHQAATDAPDDEALQKAAETAESAVETAQAELDAAVVDVVPPADPAPKDPETPDNGEVIDFEKELERLGGAGPTPNKVLTPLEKAERALFFNAEALRQLGGDPSKVIKPKEPVVVPPVVEVPPADNKGFVTQDDLNKRDLLAELRRVSRSEAEYKVLQWHAENSIRLTGDPIKDSENAYLIAHKGKITRSFDELRRAAGARPAPGTPPGRRAPAQPAAQVPALSADDMNTLTRRGFKQQQDGSWKGKRYTQRYVAGKGWVQERNKN